MNRSLPANRSVAVPGVARDLTVGLMSAVISLAITLFQDLSGTGQTNVASLQQALAPIHQQLTQLLRRVRATQTRFPAKMRPVPRMPRQSTARTPVANTTFPAPFSKLTAPLEVSYVTPKGWNQISNLDSWMADDDAPVEDTSGPIGSSFTIQESLNMTPSFASVDYGYFPEYNQDIDELERSEQFNPVFYSSLHDRFNRPAIKSRPVIPDISGSPRTPPPRRVAQLRQEASPGRRPIRRQLALDSSGHNETFSTGPVQRADGTFALRETTNVVNPDGSTARVSRTISGPDVSIVQNLNESLPPLASGTGNTTYGV